MKNPYSNKSKDPVEQLLYWIVERTIILTRKETGAPKPWTADPILQQFRFCNVQRENDAVTKWIAKNWRDPNNTNNFLWFAMLVARYINEPSTLALMKFPVPWNEKDFLKAVAKQQAAKVNVYNPAYIIATGGRSGPKHLYLAEFFGKFWDKQVELMPKRGETLQSYNLRLNEERGMGSFMSGQIIADLKYAKGCPLSKAHDWWSFASSGPGSRRGLNRMLGRDKDAPWKETEWHAELSKLRSRVNHELAEQNPVRVTGLTHGLHAQDLQNCLCEVDKMMRVRKGEGRPKQKYPGV